MVKVSYWNDGEGVEQREVSTEYPLPVELNGGDLETVFPHAAFGELLVAEPTPVFQGSFEYTVDNTGLLTNTTSGSATITQSDAMAVLSTGTTTGSRGHCRTRRQAKYHPGQGSDMRFTTLFDTPVAGTEQYIGLMDEEGSSEQIKNGWTVGYDGLTFGVHRFQNDVKTTVALADCDDPLDGTGASGMTLDPTKLNVFFIRFQYLGAGAQQFWVEDDSTGKVVVFHTILYTNMNTVPSIYQPNLHWCMLVDNNGTTSDITIKSASYGYFVQGVTEHRETHHLVHSSGTHEETGVTTETAILTIRNKSLYASKTNFIEIILLNLSGSVEASSANNLASLALYLNTTLGGTPSWTDINTTNSVVEYDIAGTTVTGGIEIFSVELAGKNDRQSQDVSNFKMILEPGESLTVAGTSDNSATMKASILWEELF